MVAKVHINNKPRGRRYEIRRRLQPGSPREIFGTTDTLGDAKRLLEPYVVEGKCSHYIWDTLEGRMVSVDCILYVGPGKDPKFAAAQQRGREKEEWRKAWK